MEDVYDTTEFFQRTSPQRIPDSHLQSPIRIVYRKFIHQPPNKWPPFVFHSLARMPIDRFLINIHSERCYGHFFSAIYENIIPQRLDWVTKNYPECTQVVSNFIEITCNTLGIPIPKIRKIPTERDLDLISMKILWEEVRTSMQELRSTNDKWIEITCVPAAVKDMHISSQFSVFRLEEDTNDWYIMDYDQVMMVADTFASRVFTLIYNDILSSDTPGKIPQTMIEKCYQIYDDELKECGNEAYIQISRWEPICMAVMLSRFDRLQRASSYYEWIKADLTAEHDKRGLKLLQYLLVVELTVEMISELHGLYRHWGHPTVNEDLGCEKVQDIATNRPIPDQLTLTKMAGALKRQFVLSFITRHGRWPRITNQNTFLGKPMYHLIGTQSKIFNLYSPEYPLEDWGLVRFGKEFDFDYHPDYTDLLDDRSISVKRSEIRSLYSSDALGYKVKPPTTDRRVLKEALKRMTVRVKEICDLVQEGNIPHEWKVIIVHAKEREMKIIARLFAMMVFEMRLYYSVTEANIKDFILKYFPQQTMTLDEADLSKRLYTLTSHPDEVIKLLSALLGIDFSSWNICWTFLSTLDVFQFLDDLFGTPGLYLASHIFFEQSMVALASHHNPPSSLINNPDGVPQPCNELWYNHLGGFEGLRQKGWTLCTIGLLLLVESMTGLKSYIIGQGDNQVCKLMIPIPENYDSIDAYIISEQVEISERIDKFIKVLQELAHKVGLHVKREETWVGMDILAYGKEILYKGAFMPQGLKRISRLLTDVNEIYPSLHTKIATLQTAGMSCSQKSYDIITPYFLCTVEAIMVISRDIKKLQESRKIPRNLVSLTENISFKQFLMCLSSDIGSCPLLSMISFLYRGHPDPLTTYTTWLSLVKDKSRIADQMYSWLSKRCYSVGRGDCELLVSNPCAVNLDSPETVSTKIRRDLEVALIGYTRNSDLKEIFTSASKKADEHLFEYLVSIDPCHPRVSHEIFRNTVTGSKLSFLSKFSNTRTTQSIFGANISTPDMARIVESMETRLVLYWIKMYKEITGVSTQNPMNLCPTNLAQSIRDDTWFPATKGRSIEGVTIPHPAHQFCFLKSSTVDDHLNALSEKVIFMIPGDVKDSIVNTRGPYPAFVGSVTREKRTGKMYSIPQASRPLKSAERLIQLRDWMTNSQTELHQFLTGLASSRTNLPIGVLEDTTSTISGGSVTHRLDDHVTKRGTLHNFRPNITTHVYYSTDTLGRFSRGLTNYNMHFQGVIHLGMSYLQLSTIHGNPGDCKYSSLQYIGDCCEQQLDNFMLSTPLVPPKIIRSNHNPLIFAVINNIPTTITPESGGFVKFVNSHNPAEAIGFILFSRCLSASNSYHIGLTEATNPLVSNIGVAEILGVGLTKIIYHLAKYLYLFLPYDNASMSELLHGLNPRVLSDIATICLLPELLPELCTLTGFSSMPEIFCNKDGVCHLLKRVLETTMSTFLDDPSIIRREAPRTVYYPSSQIGVKRLLMMWCKQIWIISYGTVDLEKEVSLIYNDIMNSDMIPTSALIQLFVSRVILNTDAATIQLTCRVCPLKLSTVPAQVLIRESRKTQRLSSFQIRKPQQALLAQPLHIVGFRGVYIMYLTCRLPHLEPVVKELSRQKTTTISVEKHRTDQSYRIFGNISTAFLKVLEIIQTEKWQISGDVITLAEGEGSIAELLLKLGANFVYYNSLIDPRRLVEQRAPGLVPTCLMNYPSQVKMGALTALTGGDLCDHNTLNSILSVIPTENVSLCSCDAETSGNFQIHLSNRILLSWLATCVQSHATYGLFKTFCHNTDVLSSTISTILLCFKTVKVVVPIYSSNETYEVYLVCTENCPRVPVELIQHCHKMNYILTAQNSDALQVPLRKFKTDRISDQPFQDDYRPELIKIWSLCNQLEFDDNAASNLHRITLFTHLYTHEKFFAWVDTTEQLAYDRALNTLQIQSDSYFGTTLETFHPIYVPKHHILHNQIELYLTCIVNCHILREVISKPRGEVLKVVEDYLSGQHDLTVAGKVLYRFKLDSKSWKKSYLKNLWRIWGHHHFYKVHKCRVDWR